MFTPGYGYYPNEGNGYWYAGTYGMAALLGYGGNDLRYYYGLGDYTNKNDRTKHTYWNQITFPTPIQLEKVYIQSSDGGDFWKRPKAWKIYGSMDDQDNSIAPVAYHRGGNSNNFSNSNVNSNDAHSDMLNSRNIINYKSFGRGSPFNKQQLTFMFDIQLSKWDSDGSKCNDILSSNNPNLYVDTNDPRGYSYNNVYSGFRIQQYQNAIWTYIAGNGIHFSAKWNVTGNDFVDSSYQYKKVKIVWTLDIKNWLNGTVPTVQRFFIDQQEFTIQQTPHGPENTSTGWPWTNFIHQGKWGSKISSMWTYPQWELYLTIFEGFWDGKNDNPNPAPDVTSIEYFRVFTRIVQPSEWDTNGMFALNSVSTYIPHEEIYYNSGDMGNDAGLTYNINSTKLYKTLTFTLDYTLMGNNASAFAKVGYMKLEGKKLEGPVIGGTYDLNDDALDGFDAEVIVNQSGLSL